MKRFKANLEFIIFAPILVFLLIAGTGLYFVVSSSIFEFSDRIIRQNLQSLAGGVYTIADKGIDRVTRKGLSGNGKATRISQVTALIEIEDFARKNETGVLIHAYDRELDVLEVGLKSPVKDHVSKRAAESQFRFFLLRGSAYYSHTFEFSPWNWRITLVKSAAGYETLVNRAQHYYLLAAVLLLIVVAILIGYLRRAIARPIRHMVRSLHERKAPDYSGIGEFEFLSKSIGQMMKEVGKSREHLEDLVQARTVELEDANAHILQKNRTLEALSSKLSKYLSPQVYASIFSGAQNVELSSKRKKLTVFFSDIVGFTEATDKMQLEELTVLLNQYLSEMSQVALEYGATIDKYIGDAIMIFFGDPDTRGVKEDALACVKMALAMQQRSRKLGTHWRDAGIESPLVSRIGIHTGYCTVGNFGSNDRMDYTIIGGAVNRASRLEHEAPAGGILISLETYSLVKEEIHCEEVGSMSMRGIAYPIATYQVLDLVENIGEDARSINVELPHLKLNFDPAQMPSNEREEASEALRTALDRLSSANRRDDLDDDTKSVRGTTKEMLACGQS